MNGKEVYVLMNQYVDENNRLIRNLIGVCSTPEKAKEAAKKLDDINAMMEAEDLCFGRRPKACILEMTLDETVERELNQRVKFVLDWVAVYRHKEVDS